MSQVVGGYRSVAIITIADSAYLTSATGRFLINFLTVSKKHHVGKLFFLVSVRASIGETGSSIMPTCKKPKQLSLLDYYLLTYHAFLQSTFDIIHYVNFHQLEELDYFVVHFQVF